MEPTSAPWLAPLIMGMLLVVTLVVLGFALRRGWRSHAGRIRMDRARRGERSARALLCRRGFSVDAEQAPGRLILSVDGAPSIHPVRADYLVSRGATRYVAEVKTGERAPSLDHPPTRRQLLEYRAAFDVDVVLLVDPEAGTIREVTLPMARRGASRALPFAMGVAVGLGLALGALALLAHPW